MTQPDLAPSVPQRSEALRLLQIQQRQHDDACHPDIARLDISRRITHLVLHLAKYAGGFAVADESQEAYRRQLIDAAIIAVSGATALGVDIRVGPVEAAPRHATLAGPAIEPRQTFLNRLVVIVGNLAKASEAADHQEDFPIRSAWESGFFAAFLLVQQEAARTGVDLLVEIPVRLESVRRKGFLAMSGAS